LHSPKTAVAALETTPHTLTPPPAPAPSAVADEILMAPSAMVATTVTPAAVQLRIKSASSASVAGVDGVKLLQLAASAARGKIRGRRGGGRASARPDRARLAQLLLRSRRACVGHVRRQRMRSALGQNRFRA
jgi:hypothetical protein